MTSFKAYLIEQDRDGKVAGRMTTLSSEQLDAGEVTLRVHYSSINYKDALAATGAGKIIRRFPCVGGIDMAGVVTDSADARFKPGDKVIATSFDIGVSHHGGYAELARVPARWVVPLPAGLDLFESMAIGTAGFTAALAIVRMEDNGLATDSGPGDRHRRERRCRCAGHRHARAPGLPHRRVDGQAGRRRVPARPRRGGDQVALASSTSTRRARSRPPPGQERSTTSADRSCTGCSRT